MALGLVSRFVLIGSLLVWTAESALTAYYEFDKAAAVDDFNGASGGVDLTGNGFNCTAYGDVSFGEDRYGNADSAAVFNGTSDCGSIGDTDCAGLDCGTELNDAIAGYSSFSICAWAYVDVSNDGALFEIGAATSCRA